MPIDMERIIRAAAQAVLDERDSDQRGRGSDQPKRRLLSTPRALMIGAGLVTAGRLVARVRGRDVLERLQQRLADYEAEHFGEDPQGAGEDPYDEEELGEDEELEDEEPYDEADEDGEEDYEEEPEEEQRSGSASRNSS